MSTTSHTNNFILVAVLAASAVYTLSSLLWVVHRSLESVLHVFYPAALFLQKNLVSVLLDPFLSKNEAATATTAPPQGTHVGEPAPIFTLVKRTATGQLVPFAVFNGSDVSVLGGPQASQVALVSRLDPVYVGLALWLTVFAGIGTALYYARDISKADAKKPDAQTETNAQATQAPALPGSVLAQPRSHPMLLRLAMTTTGADESLLTAMTTPLPTSDSGLALAHPVPDTDRVNGFLQRVIQSSTPAPRVARTGAWLDTQHPLPPAPPPTVAAHAPLNPAALRSRVAALRGAAWPRPPRRALNPAAPVFTPRLLRAATDSAASLASSASPATPHFLPAQPSFAPKRVGPSTLGNGSVAGPRLGLGLVGVNGMAGAQGRNPVEPYVFF